ncbi:MAG: NADH dehydrogenase [Candidatus Adiutrix intracellularis]|jgi:NADH-quinone oxidoreductase subunit A|nr:MAG: NADH dehydrogenase [Candidatus Adiutrix intracellularis]MDR2826789.1 NADH-quinone oxidoreductase subunit A [Candidatus Adiutrix intracellularis]
MVFDSLHLAIILFLATGLIFPVIPLLLSFVLAPRASGGDMLMPYECGMPPHNQAWGLFALNYYAYALIFIAFDVDVLYLFPISVFYKDTSGWLPFIEVTFFLFFVLLAILYFRAKGVFDWPRRIKVR